MRTPLSVLFVFITAVSFGQAYSDSGFTYKAEAKNLLVNGVEEGKWIEYDTIDDGYPNFTSSYSLSIYKNGGKYGIERYYYVSGKIWVVNYYKNGVLNGTIREYTESGMLQRVSQYKNGMLNGVDSDYWYDSKFLYMVVPYVNNKMNGLVKWFADNDGKLKEEGTYFNDEEVGLHKEFDKNGKVTRLSIDTVKRIQKMLLGKWVDVNNPINEWHFSKDTIKSFGECFTDYDIFCGADNWHLAAGTYRFTFDYMACGDSDNTRRPNFEYSCSVDSTYLKFYEHGYEPKYIFVKKK